MHVPACMPKIQEDHTNRWRCFEGERGRTEMLKYKTTIHKISPSPARDEKGRDY